MPQEYGQLGSMNPASSSHPSSLYLPAQFFVPFAQFGQSAYLSSHATVQMPHIDGQAFITAAGFAAHSCSPPGRMKKGDVRREKVGTA